jgi:outer membrane protein OmpA-like peptidoglycan-associated protein
LNSLPGPLGEVLSLTSNLRDHVLESFGPYAAVFSGAAPFVAIGLALLMLAAGWGMWSPPKGELKNYGVRLGGLLGSTGVLYLYVKSKGAPDMNFLTIALISAAIVVVSGIFYFIAHQWLCFRCPGDRPLYVRGFRMQPDAKSVLKGIGTPPLPATRKVVGLTLPTDGKDYFCRANKANPEFIWTGASLVAAHTVLLILYLGFALSLVTLLASAAFALQQADTKVVDTPMQSEIRVPTDLLFAFGKSDLSDASSATLQSISKLVLQKWKSGPIRVTGYTDSIGTADYNLKLSSQRARSVAQWLATVGQLSTVPFDIRGFASDSPVAPNTLPDGSDNPEGRRLNRRVSIAIPK